MIEAKDLFTRYCQKFSIGLYSDCDDLFERHGELLVSLCDIKMLYENLKISERDLCYFIAYLRTAHHKGWTQLLVQQEISQNIDSLIIRSNKYQQQQLKRRAYFILKKRISLYEKYNGVKYIQLLNSSFQNLQFLKDGNEPKQAVARIVGYKKLLNKLLAESMQGLSEIYTLLRLVCRLGERFDEATKSALMDHLHNSKFKELNCEDVCFTDNKGTWNYDDKPLYYESPSVQFFTLGNRVLGINNNEPTKPLYVFDYGSTQDTFAHQYQEIVNKTKEYINDLRKLKENIDDHKQYIQVLFDWYQRLISQPEITNDPIQRPIFIANQKLYFNEVSKIKNVIEERATLFSDEKLRIAHIESIFEHYVMHNLFFNLKFTIECNIPVSSLPKDNETVSYPQICQKLPEVRASDLVKYIRELLKGEISEVVDQYYSVPILTAAWFLAETGRNPLTLMITLMMLDLIEGGIPYNSDAHVKKYYNWHNILWNYSILHNNLSADRREQEHPQQEGWAGKHPMCHGGSFGRVFGNNRFPPIENPLGQVRQKEGTILINWLSNKIRLLHPDIQVELITLHGKSKPSETWYKKVTFFIYDVNMAAESRSEDKTTVIENIIKPPLRFRLSNFDLQINPNPPVQPPTPAFFPMSTKATVGVVAAMSLAVTGIVFKNEIKEGIKTIFQIR